MGWAAGSQVRRKDSTVVGVVLSDLGAGYIQVSFPDGVKDVAAETLLALEADGSRLLAQGVVEDSELHLSRIRTLFLRHAFRFDEAAGLSNSRIEPAHHQVFVAHRVVNKLHPRMILADEVGLGKTIEAGLILKELRARGLAHRVLVLVPASLSEQWRTELERKFNERFTVVDGATLKLLRKTHDDPWSELDSVIVSLPLASRDANAEELLSGKPWDLVIFDEAHRVRRTVQGANQAYRLAEGLKLSVNAMLLLTATPVQLHQMELYSLIELVEPGLFASYGDFDQRRREIPVLNRLMQGLQDWVARTPHEREDLAEAIRVLLDADVDLDSPQQRDLILDKVAHQHPLANVMIRNRKKEVDIVSERRAYPVAIEMSDVEQDLYEEVTSYLRNGYNAAMKRRDNAAGFVMVTYQKMLTSSSTALRKSLERRIEKLVPAARATKTVEAEDIESSEDHGELAASITTAAVIDHEVTYLRDLTGRLAKVQDSKAATLLNTIDSIVANGPDLKILIFTQFRETLEFLRYVLQQNGFSVVTFHGGLNPVEKEEAVHRFKDNAQILVSTEAGGEGRNLQFCHHLVNYDLPWNPMRIEQRIGRLDRFGQRFPVTIHNLYYMETLEERVLDVLARRIRVFEESVGALDPILGDFEQAISRAAMGVDAFAAERELDKYMSDLTEQIEHAREVERTLSDFAMDRMSLRRDQANDLLKRPPLASGGDLKLFVEDAVARLGGTVMPHQDGGWQISLSPRLGARLRLDRAAYRGSFDPKEALALEDLDFFALGNVFVDRLLDLVEHQPSALVGARRDTTAPEGTFVEVVWEIEKRGLAPRGRLVRHLVSSDLEVSSSRPPFGVLVGPAIDLVPPAWAADALEASRVLWAEERTAINSEFTTEFDVERVTQIERERRLAVAKERGYRERMEQLAGWFADRAGGMSARDTKIAPANRQRLANATDGLDRVQAELDQHVEELERQQPQVEARLLWVGLVEGGN
jgi:superfamily II DNA or RNA helicase